LADNFAQSSKIEIETKKARQYGGLYSWRAKNNDSTPQA
jgi:hypothetical protein